MARIRSDHVFKHAQKFAIPFRTTLGHPWAIVPDGAEYYRAFAVESAGFRQWLRQSFHSEHHFYPSPNTIEEAVRKFNAHGQRSDLPEGNVFTRLGWDGDRSEPESMLLDLGNTRNERIEITSRGYRVTSGDPWVFLKHSSTVALERPVKSGFTLREHLRALLDLNGMALDRAVVWLFAALRLGPPYPILTIGGPAGSGRTMLATMLRFLIDPCSFPVQELPADESILLSQALHNHVLIYDLASGLPPKTRDLLVRMAAGTGLGSGENPDGPRPLGRPIIVTGSSEDPAFGRDPVLAEGAMRIELGALDAKRALPRLKLGHRYTAAAPAILGTLSMAAAFALADGAAGNSAAVGSDWADVVRWVTAAGPVLGIGAEQVRCALSGSAVVEALHRLLDGEPEWSGTSDDLLARLGELGFAGVANSAEALADEIGAMDLASYGIGTVNDGALLQVRRTGGIGAGGGARIR